MKFHSDFRLTSLVLPSADPSISMPGTEGHEGHEGAESHEGDEGNEGLACETS